MFRTFCIYNKDVDNSSDNPKMQCQGQGHFQLYMPILILSGLRQKQKALQKYMVRACDLRTALYDTSILSALVPRAHVTPAQRGTWVSGTAQTKEK